MAGKPTVTLIKGLHITAAEKRGVLTSINTLRNAFADALAAVPTIRPNYGGQRVFLRHSPKSYVVEPLEGRPGDYAVAIITVEKDDRGRRVERRRPVTVRVSGIDHLYMPGAPTIDPQGVLL